MAKEIWITPRHIYPPVFPISLSPFTQVFKPQIWELALCLLSPPPSYQVLSTLPSGHTTNLYIHLYIHRLHLTLALVQATIGPHLDSYSNTSSHDRESILQVASEVTFELGSDNVTFLIHHLITSHHASYHALKDPMQSVH